LIVFRGVLLAKMKLNVNHVSVDFDSVSHHNGRSASAASLPADSVSLSVRRRHRRISFG
jgi:hypothetical protein